MRIMLEKREEEKLTKKKIISTSNSVLFSFLFFDCDNKIDNKYLQFTRKLKFFSVTNVTLRKLHYFKRVVIEIKHHIKYNGWIIISI